MPVVNGGRLQGHGTPRSSHESTTPFASSGNRVMSGTDLSIERRLRALMGPEAHIESDSSGTLTVAPRTAAACALVLETANAEGWRVRIAGNGTWNKAEGSAQLTLSSCGLADVEDVRAADLVATVQAGVSRETLRLALADQGAWWPVDPPGDRRSVGSVVATATAGPLRSGYGGIRDHVLGLTVVTADGRLIHSGGRVVKNVAGFDLTKLAIGSFGAFGFIARVHLRLRAIPRADVTLLAQGDRDTLIHGGQSILATGLTPSAIEILSPAASGNPRWTLAIRLIGSDASVPSDRAAVRGVCSMSLTELGPGDAAEFWRSTLQHPTQHPITIRMGTVIGGLDRALDLVSHHLDDDAVTASVAAGTIRWSGTADADRIRLVRHAAAQVEMPVTIERAPWTMQQQLGHFGAYREGVSRLMGSLRDTFDPNRTLVVGLGAET